LTTTATTATTATMTTQQIKDALILSCEQEKHVELLQLTMIPKLSALWAPLAAKWSLLATQRLQQNAVYLDGLLESEVVVEEGDDSVKIPPTPVEYTRLITLEKLIDRYGLERNPLDIIYKRNELFATAIETGDIDTVDLLLSNKEDVITDASDCFGRFSPLLLATKNGHLTIVDRLLLENEVFNFNIADPLFLSAENNHVELVDRLLQIPGIGDRYYEALQVAIKEEHVHVIERLLQDDRVDPLKCYWTVIDLLRLRKTDELQRTRAPEILDILLKDGRLNPAFNHNMMIQQAVSSGNVKTVDRLLQDPRVNPSSLMLLATAIGLNFTSMLERLLQDPRVDPIAENSLKIAVELSRSECVKILLRDPRIDPSADENLVIIRALQMLSTPIEITEMLMADKRVDPSARDNRPLKFALQLRRVNHAKLLLTDKRVGLPISTYEAFISVNKEQGKSGSEEIIELITQEIAKEKVKEKLKEKTKVKGRRL